MRAGALAWGSDRRRVGFVLTGMLVAALLPFAAASPAQAAEISESESNGSRSTADVVAVGATISGSSLTASNADDDYYAVDLPGDGRFALNFKFASGLGAGPAYDVYVYDASGNTRYSFELTGDKYAGTLLPTYATFAPAGRMYVRIAGLGSWTSWGKAYTLSVGFTPGLVETESTSSRSTADVVAVGATISGSSLTASNADDDYYAVDVATARKVALNLTFPSGLGAARAYEVDVYNQSGSQLYAFELTGDRSNGSWLASQAVSLPAGRSYLRVSGVNSQKTWGKAYQLTVLSVLSATPVPKISGTAKVGSTLTAKPGTWSPAPVTLKYQWLRNGAAIPGATAAGYQLTASDVAAAITVRVTGSKTGYTSVAKTSTAVTPTS